MTMIMLYISSHDNLGLLDDLTEERQILVKKLVGEHSLGKIILGDMLNLNGCQYLVVDLSSLKDDDDSIIRAIVAVKSMYDTRIIILAQGYRRGNALLARLFAEGIYNIVTQPRLNDTLEDLAHCIDTGKEYRDAVVYRADPEEVANGSSSRVIVKKEVSHTKQTVSIGVCGILPRIGTTTQALQITSFLHQSGYYCCYIQDHDGEIETLAHLYEVDQAGPLIRLGGLDLFTECAMSTILPKEYEFLVYDCGSYDGLDLQRFLSFDERIICVGSKPWEAVHLQRVFADIHGIEDIHFLFSFVDESEQGDVKRLMGPYASTTQFAAYEPDLMGHGNEGIHRHILYRWLKEETAQETGKRKKRVWGRKK